ncbi:MAG TPA: hypothetical protein VI461_15135, partial [Chitinophagaceae bacterium]|nr:hypothetical protein [Chitinophagaceae bacterium]
MRKSYSFLLIAVFLCCNVQIVKAQSVAINNDGSIADPSAVLDLKSNNKGLLIPRLSTIQRLAIATPAEGLKVFDTDTKTFWFYNGTGWIEFSTGSATNFWSLDGNNIFKTNTGNVGIGTNNPSSILTLQTPLNSTGFMHIGGSNEIIIDESIEGVSASIGTNTNHPFRIKANNTGLLHIYPAGEVVVGSNLTNSFSRLTVETLNNSYGISHLGENGNILSTRMGGTSAGIGTFSNTNMRLFANGNSAMIIDAANGNIGIGTDAPSSRLHVAGTTRLDGYGDFLGEVGIGTIANPGTALTILKDNEAIRITGNQSYITFFNGASYKGYVWNKGADDMELGTAGVNANGKLFLSVKGTPYLTLQSNGQVSIAGPPAPYLNPAFTVAGNGILSLASPLSEWTIEPLYCGGGTAGPCLLFSADGFTRSRVDAAGDWVSLSDKSVKDAIKNYKPVLENIKRL